MAGKPSRYVNRELSWLEFNQRVLDEATDVRIPLLERLKFLAITASNLDEFFMVRVGGLQMLRKSRRLKRDLAGMTPRQQLIAISRRAREMVEAQYDCLLQQLEPPLAQAGIERVVPDQLQPRQASVVDQVFDAEVFPVFTPMAIHPETPFPLLINRALNICVRLAPPADECKERFAIIPLGPSPNRFMQLPSESGYRYMLLEELICSRLADFFPSERILDATVFRITRNADMRVREDMAADLMAGMEEILGARRESDCVRLEVASNASAPTLRFLQESLDVEPADVYLCPGPLDLSAFMGMTGLQGFDDLKYETWEPRPSPQIDLAGSIFEAVRREDVMLSLPYESFEPVVRMIEQAAEDPDVLAIKIILYRTSRNSPIVAALRKAAATGKHVTAIVELKARFDEARNIEWAKTLELEGVQVIYGVRGLKTHAKVCIIIRREPHGIRRYVHFATGNYNEVTARLYSDISFLSCDEELAADASSFFNAITGYSQPQPYRKIAAAPHSLRERLIELINAEIDRKQQGQKAKIMAQINSLADPKVIDALYRASQAGVPIRLNVRGICCLRPGVKGLSENIRVVSILDRYLEHSRIIYFYHGGDELVFISSADWMPRNLDKRVELLVPIEHMPIRRRLIELLHSYANDNVKARKILADGSYESPGPIRRGESARRHQQKMYELAVEAERRQLQSQRTVFRPHRAANKEN